MTKDKQNYNIELRILILYTNHTHLKQVYVNINVILNTCAIMTLNRSSYLIKLFQMVFGQQRM